MALSGSVALAAVFDAFGPEACYVSANGYVSREAFAVQDWPQTFYMIGSMGLAGSIALGLALAQPERQIVVLDGDGNVLMGLGGLALVGSQGPLPLVHVCLDNGVYASTGNQASLAGGVSLEGIASAAGYAQAQRVETASELESALSSLRDAEAEGPAFLRVMIETEPHPRSFARVSHSPLEIRDRFRGALAAGPAVEAP